MGYIHAKNYKQARKIASREIKHTNKLTPNRQKIVFKSLVALKNRKGLYYVTYKYRKLNKNYRGKR